MSMLNGRQGVFVVTPQMVPIFHTPMTKQANCNFQHPEHPLLVRADVPNLDLYGRQRFHTISFMWWTFCFCPFLVAPVTAFSLLFSLVALVSPSMPLPI